MSLTSILETTCWAARFGMDAIAWWSGKRLAMIPRPLRSSFTITKPIRSKPRTSRQTIPMLSKQGEAKPQWKKGTASKSAQQPAKGKFDRAAAFTKRDLDQDGYLSKEEFLKGQPDPDAAPLRFPKFDKDQDGKLSREEFVKP